MGFGGPAITSSFNVSGFAPKKPAAAPVGSPAAKAATRAGSFGPTSTAPVGIPTPAPVPQIGAKAAKANPQPQVGGTYYPTATAGGTKGGPSSSASATGSFDIMSALAPLLQQHPAAPTAASAPAPELSNVAQDDPDLRDYLNRTKKRLDDPEGSTKRAIDVAGSAIRDVGEGEKAGLYANAARRGVLSSSTIPQIGEAAISKDVQSNVGKAAAGIALQREKDNDAFLAGSQNAFAAPGAAGRADKSLALNQWEAANQNQRAMEAANISAWQANLGLLGNLLRL